MNLIEHPEIIDETGAGPSRINTHIHNGDVFFLISACRANLSSKENGERTELLKKHLTNCAAVAFIPAIGKFHEMGHDLPSIENSFFVLRRSSNTNPKKFIAFGEKLMGIFGQEAYIYGDGKNIVLKSDGDEPFILGDAVSFRAEITQNAVGTTTVKGRDFTFVGSDDQQATAYGAGKTKKLA